MSNVESSKFYENKKESPNKKVSFLVSSEKQKLEEMPSFYKTSKEYFGIKGELDSLEFELEAIGLDINYLLDEYRKHIEENLKGISKNVLDKVKLSIKTKVLQLGNIISKIKKDEIKRYGNLDRFAENRWIINAKIEEELGLISHKVLPSLEAYLKLKSGEKFPDKFLNRFDTSNGVDYSGRVPKNPDYINPEYHLEETEELIKAKVNEDGDFDEGFFSTQKVFNINNSSHKKALDSIGIKEIKINILNEEDRAIEGEAILYFMAMIGVQIGVETLGGLVGTFAGGGVDLYDVFSKDESLLIILQKIGVVESSYRMDKTWIDNILAGLGLIPGVTQLVKGSKLAKFLEKIPPKKFEEAILKIKKNISLRKASKIHFSSLNSENISSLMEKEKLAIAKFLLKRNLTKKQKEAIIQAHKIGEERRGNGIFRFTQSELLQKTRLLKDAEFSSTERKKLLENGVCSVILEREFPQTNFRGNNLDEKLDDLFVLAKSTESDYNKLLKEIGEQTGAYEVLDSTKINLKDKSKAKDKIEKLFGEKHPEKLRDILRGSIIYEDLDDLRRGVNALRSNSLITFIRQRDRTYNLFTNDVIVNVRFRNGFVAELQFHIKETFSAKEKGTIFTKKQVDFDKLWKKEDYDIVEKLKKGTLGERILAYNINLPNHTNRVSGHDIYELRRSLGKTEAEKNLKTRLSVLERFINELAREEYKKRTGKEFK